MLKKMAVIGLTAGALVLAAPAAASAASFETPPPPNTYAETPRVSVGDPIITPCEASTIAFSAGYFLPGERVSVSVSGHNAGDASISGNTAAGDGSLVVSFRPPSDGEGSYSLSFAGGAHSGGAGLSAASGSLIATAAQDREYTATVTVVQAGGVGPSCEQDPGVAPSGTELPLTGSTDSGMELALTGGSASPWILGGGAVALAAGGVLIAAGAARRRRS
ncbi:hypothetical protein [Microbacterium sp. CIAB417]|uniref:hypothetical protein n=1 Tax=Microbacterium sp. CIAB417 TaxID=2860287 RepID=UPI001FAE4847|nr:hypothetical protein [Microbacterium sp. CIAB417]